MQLQLEKVQSAMDRNPLLAATGGFATIAVGMYINNPRAFHRCVVACVRAAYARATNTIKNASEDDKVNLKSNLAAQRVVVAFSRKEAARDLLVRLLIGAGTGTVSYVGARTVGFNEDWLIIYVVTMGLTGYLGKGDVFAFISAHLGLVFGPVTPFGLILAAMIFTPIKVIELARGARVLIGRNR